MHTPKKMMLQNRIINAVNRSALRVVKISHDLVATYSTSPREMHRLGFEYIPGFDLPRKLAKEMDRHVTCLNALCELARTFHLTNKQ